MKNYYEDIPDGQFVPLTCVPAEFQNQYEINKLGQIRTIKTGRIREGKVYKDYKQIKLTAKTEICRAIHVLLAQTFLSNPEKKPVVDHIDRNRLNNSLSNLRWVTYSENSHNRTPPKEENTIFIKLDKKDGKEIERYFPSELGRRRRDNINASISRGGVCEGYYWKRINRLVEEYIKEFGEPDKNGWKTCLRVPYFECNVNGLLRIKKTKTTLVGALAPGRYYRVRHNSIQYSVHRLVCETFLGRLLSEDEVVDHINTNTRDNRFCNLRAGSHKDNMNNPLTIAKRQKAVLQYSIDGKFIKRYSSVTEAADVFNPNLCTFRDCILHRHIAYGYLWCYDGEEDQILKKLEQMIFKYDSKGNQVAIFKSVLSAASASSASTGTIFRYLNRRDKPCIDGFYYTRGPRKS